MKRYLIDANIWVLLLHRKNDRIKERVETLEADQCWISSISVAELYYGARNSRHPKENESVIDALLSGPLNVFPFTGNHARAFGEIRFLLKKKGTLIGPYDLLLAAQAKAEELVMVTNKQDEFRRVPNLRLEDWSE